MMPRIKILFITHSDSFTGSSKSLLALLEGLLSFNIEPFVILPCEGVLQEKLDDIGITSQVLPVVYWVSNKKNKLYDTGRFVLKFPLSFVRIYKKMKEWDIDLVYTNSSVYPVGRIVSFLGKIPHIWHIREFGDLDFSYKYILSDYLSQKLISSSNAIVCNSYAVKNYHFGNKLDKKISVIYNGIARKKDFNIYRKEKQKEQNDDSFIFLIVGTISPNKGQKTAIKAIHRIKEMGYSVKLKVVGSGKSEYVNSLMDLVIDFGVSDIVEFTGFVNDPYYFYLKADCLLMCSEHEAFGRVTAEAMSACLPVIGKNRGGTSEIIKHGETGLLYDNFDELVDAMIKMVQNPEWGKDLGMAGWERAKEYYNIETYAENVFKVINKVMKDKHGST